MADKDIDYQALLDAEIAKDDYRKNYSLSAEARAKLSEAGKRRWQDPEYRERMEGRTGQGEGGSLTKEMREKISQAKKGKPAHNKGKGKRIMTPNGEFPSLTAVAEAAGVGYFTVYNWMTQWPEHYYYIDKTRRTISKENRERMGRPKGVRSGKPVTTPLGNFANTYEASVAQKISTNTIGYYFRTYPEQYYYTKDKK